MEFGDISNHQIFNNQLILNLLAIRCSVMQIQSKLMAAGEEGGMHYCLECSTPHQVCVNCFDTSEYNMPSLSSLRHWGSIVRAIEDRTVVVYIRDSHYHDCNCYTTSDSRTVCGSNYKGLEEKGERHFVQSYQHLATSCMYVPLHQRRRCRRFLYPMNLQQWQYQNQDQLKTVH